MRAPKINKMDKERIGNSMLKDEYQKWCQDNSVEPVSQRTFRTRLVEKGIGEGRSSDGKTRIWRGIRLRTDNDVITDISDKTKENAKLTDKNRQDLQENPLIKEKQKDFIANSVSNVSFVSNGDIPASTRHRKAYYKEAQSQVPTTTEQNQVVMNN